MTKEANGLSWSRFILGIVRGIGGLGGLVLICGTAVAAPQSRARNISSAVGSQVWLQPSDAMIKKGCEYKLELKQGDDILEDFSRRWRVHGEYQVVNQQMARERPRPSPQNGSYSILVKNCCGIGDAGAKIGDLRFQFTHSHKTTYNYTLFADPTDDSPFTVKPDSNFLKKTLTTDIGLAKGASCP